MLTINALAVADSVIVPVQAHYLPLKVEIIFDSNKLTKDEMEKICEQTDQIFEKEDLYCADKQPGRRVYLDRE